MSDRFTLHAHAAQSELTDSQREDFLRALDKAALDGVNVTDFEAQFIGDFLACPSRWVWTSPRRHVADEMRNRYAHRIPSRTASAGTGTGTCAGTGAGPKIPPFVPGACAWLQRSEGRSQRCGQPATQKTRQGLELCDLHFREHLEGVERIRQMKARR